MVEPQKPFACGLPDCGMSFTNEDHLNVHTKKHDMVLQLGLEQKTAFVADQTPTPTRFIRNCEEVGLFQDLQNVNPFDEGFKRAMDTKHGILCLESAMGGSSSEDLHTPQMVFPLIESGDSALFSATNNKRNIIISRSSSDETGTITVSKLTNEVTTITGIVTNKDLEKISSTDDLSLVKTTDAHQKEVIKAENNIANVEPTNVPTLVYDSVKDNTADILPTDNSKLQVPEKALPPIMSQKSLDFVVDSLTSEINGNTVDSNEKGYTLCVLKTTNAAKRDNSKIETSTNPLNVLNNTKAVKTYSTSPNKPDKEPDNVSVCDYEVVLKFPGGKEIKMKPVEQPPKDTSKTVETATKEVLKKALTDKIAPQKIAPAPRVARTEPQVQNVINLPSGTLIPVTLVNQAGKPIATNNLTKVPVTNVTTSNLNTMPKLAPKKVPITKFIPNSKVPLSRVSLKAKIPSKLAVITKCKPTNNTSNTTVSVAKNTFKLINGQITKAPSGFTIVNNKADPNANNKKATIQLNQAPSNQLKLATVVGVKRVTPKIKPRTQDIMNPNLRPYLAPKTLPPIAPLTYDNKKSKPKTNDKKNAPNTEANVVCVTQDELIEKINQNASKYEVASKDTGLELRGGLWTETNEESNDVSSAEDVQMNEDNDCMLEDAECDSEVKRTRWDLDSRSAASKRYRGRLKEATKRQVEENRRLREANQRLVAEKAVLKLLITEHMKRCPNAEDLRITAERLQSTNNWM